MGAEMQHTLGGCSLGRTGSCRRSRVAGRTGLGLGPGIADHRAAGCSHRAVAAGHSSFQTDHPAGSHPVDRRAVDHMAAGCSLADRSPAEGDNHPAGRSPGCIDRSQTFLSEVDDRSVRKSGRVKCERGDEDDGGRGGGELFYKESDGEVTGSHRADGSTPHQFPTSLPLSSSVLTS